jgi:heme/copper-type cytochrome/quinol oxidase subunit 3
MTSATAEALTAPTESKESKGHSIAWWGMAVLIMTEAMIFATLLSAYVYLRAASTEWPLGGIEPPELKVIWLFTAILLGSSGPMFFAENGIRKGNQMRLRLGLALVTVMGVIFFCYLIYEYRELEFGIRDNAYGSLFYSIIGLHGAHVMGGLLMIGMLQIKAWQGKFSAERHETVAVIGMYWHFVDVVWVFVFSTLYLSANVS